MSFRSLSAGEEPPRKKNKASQILPQTTISSLPDDLVLSCLARVSRLYYPTLSLVSKKFRSIIASPELYEVRSILGRTESCLYVCLLLYPDSHPRWFTLCQKPDTRTKKKKKKKKKQSSGNLLVPIPFSCYFKAFRSSVVAIGSSIYFIGGFINKFRSSNVSILDCRSHTWHQAPDMKTARNSKAVNVVDGKIYVIGGGHTKDYNSNSYTKDYNSSKWIEVFDPKTQIWNYVSSRGLDICGTDIIHSTEIDGKIYMYGDGKEGAAYNPKDDTWEPIELGMCIGWVSNSHCVIDNVLFSYYDVDERLFIWFDTKSRVWRNLKGVEGITSRIAKGSCVELADYGGRMVVLWDRDVLFSSGCEENNKVWCAVIAVERCDGDEIWGTVEWVDVVFSVPRAYQFVHVLSVTL